MWKNEPFSKGQAWTDILLLANHKKDKILIGNEIEVVEIGAFITSELKLMERWKWSKNKIRMFLKLLENENMIVKDSNRKRTTIKVVNYSKYQVIETTKEPQKNCEETTKEPQEDCEETTKGLPVVHKQERKNERIKESTKDICAFFESVWKLYPNKKGKGQVSDSKKAVLFKIGFEEMKRAILRYQSDLDKDDWRKPQNGSTFFNSGYVDYLDANYENKKEGDNRGSTGRKVEPVDNGIIEQAIKAGINGDFEGF